MGTKGMLLAYCLMNLWVILQLSQAKKTLRRHRVKMVLLTTMEIAKELTCYCLSFYPVYDSLSIVKRTLWSKEKSSD